MTVYKITNHEDTAASELAGGYLNNVDLELVLRSIASRVQQIENAIWKLWLLIDIDQNPTGWALAQLGRWMGLNRGDVLTDADFRSLLKQRMISNTSTGKITELLAIADAQTVAGFKAYQIDTGTLWVSSTTQNAPEDQLTLTELTRASKAGVRNNYMTFAGNAIRVDSTYGLALGYAGIFPQYLKG
jgi:hypothetical protein